MEERKSERGHRSCRPSPSPRPAPLSLPTPTTHRPTLALASLPRDTFRQLPSRPSSSTSVSGHSSCRRGGHWGTDNPSASFFSCITRTPSCARTTRQRRNLHALHVRSYSHTHTLTHSHSLTNACFAQSTAVQLRYRLTTMLRTIQVRYRPTQRQAEGEAEAEAAQRQPDTRTSWQAPALKRCQRSPKVYKTPEPGRTNTTAASQSAHSPGAVVPSRGCATKESGLAGRGTGRGLPSLVSPACPLASFPPPSRLFCLPISIHPPSTQTTTTTTPTASTNTTTTSRGGHDLAPSTVLPPHPALLLLLLLLRCCSSRCWASSPFTSCPVRPPLRDAGVASLFLLHYTRSRQAPQTRTTASIRHLPPKGIQRPRKSTIAKRPTGHLVTIPQGPTDGAEITQSPLSKLPSSHLHRKLR